MSEYDHHDPLKLISLLDTRDARIAQLENERDEIEQDYIKLRESKVDSGQCWRWLSRERGERIAQLEDERDVFARTLNKRDERIAELEAERDQWQESSGQNYVRAQEAEAREETLRSEVERLRAFRDTFKESDG